ncbi:cell division protein FtsQ/DivIB [Chondromyces apiculatus]|uniref:Cell division protein FtsQ n=1 Tax=Chondromyces apiculatus DSM 436 TaxID=1192034 RepID=A0A017SZG7_9BACT|nr:FtsQ-type POTRA domain-containing protein [Chondromyces apiculatus]EYF02384.1 Cell division protein FtsQ [Chondromyces apiculatus DSM 436]
MNAGRRSSAPPPPNRRIAPAPEAPAPKANTRKGDSVPPVKRGTTSASPSSPPPNDRRASSPEDSPAPPATSVSVRPPGRTGAAAPPVKKAPSLPRGLRWLQLLAGVVVVVAASIGVGWGARRYVMSSPRFAIRTVLIEGEQRRSAQQVADAGAIAVGKNIFTLDPAMAGAAIAADPWIEKATVTRRLPSTIHVAVVEREARALVAIGGDLYLATRDGDLFKQRVDDDPADLPVVTGITPEHVARDRPGVVLSVRRTLDVLDDIDRSGISRRYPVEELHVEKDGTLVFILGKEAIALHLGSPPYRDKIAQAAQVLNELARRKANASVIFLDSEAHPERVVVRMR